MTKHLKDVLSYEQGEQDEDQTVAFFQRIINDGTVWHLQGAYGRKAMELIRNRLCMLGKQGFHDAYGNYVPSRYEVKEGTKGSAKSWIV
jgi:hypothetical protein